MQSLGETCIMDITVYQGKIILSVGDDSMSISVLLTHDEAWQLSSKLFAVYAEYLLKGKREDVVD